MVGYGRAEKQQVQQMVKLLLGCRRFRSPHDAADALAVAICHVHSQLEASAGTASKTSRRGEDQLASLQALTGPRDRASARADLREAAESDRRRRQRRRLRRVRAVVDVLRLGEPGGEVALRIHTHVREDALALYGFATPLEQELFERLIGISGIGPKLALAVLSGIEPLELVRAIERGDVGAADGDSRRRQEDIRAHRARAEGSAAADLAVPAAGTASAIRSLHRCATIVLSALVNLGYHRPLAEKAVASALKAAPDAGFERTLKQALRELAK